ncbi:MAG: hypothetical protein OXI03_09950, partial [Chloroflexota bacterium]|nr:hypothetical protein [Chloroflexota bacterium]
AAGGLLMMLLARAALVGRMPWSSQGGGGLLGRSRALRLLGAGILAGYLVGIVVTVSLGIETG